MTEFQRSQEVPYLTSVEGTFKKKKEKKFTYGPKLIKVYNKRKNILEDYMDTYRCGE